MTDRSRPGTAAARAAAPALAVAAGWAAAQAAGLSIASFSHVAPIDLPKAPAAGVVEIDLPEEVHHVCAPDLSDLRIVADGAQEVAYFVSWSEGSDKGERVPAALLDATFVPGVSTTVIANFGEKVLKNRLDVVTSGTAFRREVLIEGSDDAASWQRVREKAYVVRVEKGAGMESPFERSAVDIPPNDMKFLRVTVMNEAGDAGRIEVQSVSAWDWATVPAVTAEVEVKSLVRTEEKDGKSVIEIGLGHSRLPLYDLDVVAGDANFWRSVTVLGRNEAKRVERFGMEGGGTGERTVDVPWETISSRQIMRFSAGGEVVESTRLDLLGSRVGNLRVEVSNGSDRPLDVRALAVRRLVYSIDFQAEAERKYELYAGSPGAPQPAYDIGHFIGRLRADGVLRAGVGPLLPNPASAPAQERAPASERHGWIVWVALIVLVGVMAVLVFRLARRGRPVT